MGKAVELVRKNRIMIENVPGDTLALWKNSSEVNFLPEFFFYLLWLTAPNYVDLERRRHSMEYNTKYMMRGLYQASY